jgi:hypothetical protein
VALQLFRASARAASLAGVLCAAGQPASAQVLPSRPVTIGDQITISGDVAATTSCAQSADAVCTSDTGFFNYSQYDLSTIRMLRAGISAAVTFGERVALLGDMRFENVERPRPYGLYLRVRPWANRAFDLQVGRVPTTFGAAARRAYATDNPLIGFPLAYQYLTSLRPDALPARPEDLVRMRGRGWLSSFPVGNQTPEAGLPLADAFHWDTGLQAHGVVSWVEITGSVTAGSLAHPLFRDDNGGRHYSGRLALRPVAGLVVGVSGSRAPYATTAAAQAAGVRAGDVRQRAIGWDVEYSRGPYLLRLESVHSRFTVPAILDPLDATGTALEGRYKVSPGLYVAARADHLGFSTIATSSGGAATWEAPVTRWEVGGGYALRRNAHLRLSWQHNSRDGGRVRRLTAVAAQLLYWF